MKKAMTLGEFLTQKIEILKRDWVTIVSIFIGCLVTTILCFTLGVMYV